MSKSIQPLTPEQQILVTHITEMQPEAQAAAWQFLQALYSVQGELRSREEFMEKLYAKDVILKKEWGEYIQTITKQLDPLRLWMGELGYVDRARAAA
jgi:hypothetical protein